MAKTKVQFDFDPLDYVKTDKKVSRGIRDDILDQVADYVLESVLVALGNSQSPVTGRDFKALSEEYAKDKRARGGTPVANLLMSGDLYDSITVKRVKNKLRLTVEGDEEQAKADGHNNFSGKSKLPRRPFIPNESKGEDFDKEIREGIATIVEESISGD